MINPSNTLERIANDVRERLEERRRTRVFSELLGLAESSPRRNPEKALNALKARGCSVIAEVKMGSPSRGVIAVGLEPVQVAGDYLRSGAVALSVLTEQDHFGGDPSSLQRIRAAHPDALLLQKDFFVDEEQLLEARIYGADMILLIVALLGEEKTAAMLAKAKVLGLAALVEVHDEDELRIAASVGARLIGVNNRNLKTLEISLETSRRLIELAPKDTVLVSESGLSTAEELREFSALGYDAFLMGTSFMKTQRPGEALAQLLMDLQP